MKVSIGNFFKKVEKKKKVHSIYQENAKVKFCASQG